MATAKSNTNTTETIKKGKQITQASLDAEIKKAGKELQEEKKVSVKIPAYLQKRLGKVHPVGINGAIIYIPVGKEVQVPQSYKKVLENSIDELSL